MSAASLPSQPQVRPAHLFKPGQSGNPAGPKPGYKQKLSKSYLKELHDLWEARGKGILEQLADEKPELVLRAVAEIAVATKGPSDSAADQARGLFDASSFIAGAILGRAGANHPLAGAERLVLPAALCAEESGRGEAMDSGPLPGSAGEPE